MFCPKCGSRNQDDISYCRECGENLQVVSQAMKGQLSVKLVSKIDAVIEKKNERFRRDAILNALGGSAFLFAGAFGLITGSSTFYYGIYLLAAGIGFVLWAAWKFLEYRRSLELRTGHGQLFLSGKASNEQFIYCPKCRLQSLKTTLFCPSCGTDLQIATMPTGLEKYLPQYLITKLDVSVATNEAKPFEAQFKPLTLPLIAIFFLFVAFMLAAEGKWGEVAMNLVIGLSCLVTGSWNLFAFRRAAKKENPQDRSDEQSPGAEHAPVNGLHPQNARSALLLASQPASVTEGTTHLLDPLMDQIEREKVPTTRELVDPR